MKTAFALLAVSLGILLAGCASAPNPITEPAVVEASCGQCLFGLKGKGGCDLAVRIDGKSYFVDGFTIAQFGDTHADDGMCNVVRKAKVTGEVRNGRFAASTFEVLPVAR